MAGEEAGHNTVIMLTAGGTFLRSTGQIDPRSKLHLADANPWIIGDGVRAVPTCTHGISPAPHGAAPVAPGRESSHWPRWKTRCELFLQFTPPPPLPPEATPVPARQA